jgi:uncharacterized protein
MSNFFMDKNHVTENFAVQSWQRVLFAEFEAVLSSNTRLFPCIYGAAGFRSNNLRFCFLEEIKPEVLAPVLEAYPPEARSHGKNAFIFAMHRAVK